MSRFSRVLHHIDMNDVKIRHQEKIVAAKLEEERIREEKEYIASVVEKEKSDWKKELEESQWTPVQSSRPTNSTSQTFQHTSGTTITVSSGLGGEDAHSTAPVTVDWGFGETEQVAPPTFNQLPLAGLPMPVSAADPMARRNNAKKAEEINKQLDASEKVAAKARADALMKARLEEEKKYKAHQEWVTKVDKLVKEAKEKHSEYVRQEQINIVAKAAKISKDDATKLYDNNYFVRGKTGIALYWDKQSVPHINYFKQSRRVEVEYESGKWKWTGNPKEALRKTSWHNSHLSSWYVEKDTGHRITGSQSLIDVGGGKLLVNAEYDMAKNGKDWSKVKGIWDYNDPTRSDADSLGYKVWQNFMPLIKNIEAALGEQPQCDTCNDVFDSNNWDLNRFQPEVIAAKAAAQKAQEDIMQRHYDNYEKNVRDDVKQIVQKDPKFMEMMEENPEIMSVLAGDKEIIQTLPSEKITILDKAVGWYLRALSKHPIIDTASKSGAFVFGDWAIRYAQGDWSPITKSPGPAFDNVVKNLIKDNTKPGQLSGAIDSYGKYNYKGPMDAIVKGISSLSLGRFSYNITPNKDGTGTIDFNNEKFNFEALAGKKLFTSVGPLGFIPGMQKIADLMVNIGDKRATEKGIDPRSGKGGIPINIKLKLSKEEMKYYLGNQTKTKGESKSTPQTKRQSLSLDEPLIIDKKKKKKVNESTFETVKQLRKMWEYDGKPSPDGFPDNPPPKLKNGWHPEYGNKDSSYNRLDPESAKAMPKTGNKKIDAKVEKAKKKKK